MQSVRQLSYPALLCFSCLLLFSRCASAVQKDDRPNIIFLMADDQCTRSMGCYGAPGVKTPNLDRLAADGIVFDNHYDTTAICMASRANVVTGLLEYRAACNFGHGPLIRDRWNQSYPILLRKAGYMTAFAGKIGFEVADRPGAKSKLPESDFDRWGAGPGQTSYETKKNKSIAHYADEYPHSTRAYGAFGSDFIRDAAKNPRPFCLSISFKAPHRPVSPDPLYNDVYAGKTFPKAENYGRDAGLHFSKQSQQGRQYERFTSWNYYDKYDEVMAQYYQQIYAIDVAVGMIRDTLQESDQAENTVIIYTSDNGFLCGAHGYGSKVLPYEEASRVPLIIFDPRHENSGKGLRSNALTGNIDFAPTILEYAGVKVPPGIDGRSMTTLYDNPDASIRETLELINVWGPKAVHSLAVMTKDWKYIYWSYGEKGFTPTEELYSMTDDRLELRNLAANASHANALKGMRSHYDAAVDKWKKNAAQFHKYAHFGVIFDRNIPWSEKAEQVVDFNSTR